MDADSDIQIKKLPETLYAYAMGDTRSGAGISIISNDADGFATLTWPLTRAQIRNTILAHLDLEEFAAGADVERLRARCDDDAEIDEIAAAHQRWFTESRRGRASLDDGAA